MSSEIAQTYRSHLRLQQIVRDLPKVMAIRMRFAASLRSPAQHVGAREGNPLLEERSQHGGRAEIAEDAPRRMALHSLSLSYE